MEVQYVQFAYNPFKQAPIQWFSKTDQQSVLFRHVFACTELKEGNQVVFSKIMFIDLNKMFKSGFKSGPRVKFGCPKTILTPNVLHWPFHFHIIALSCLKNIAIMKVNLSPYANSLRQLTQIKNIALDNKPHTWKTGLNACAQIVVLDKPVQLADIFIIAQYSLRIL